MVGISDFSNFQVKSYVRLKSKNVKKISKFFAIFWTFPFPQKFFCLIWLSIQKCPILARDCTENQPKNLAVHGQKLWKECSRFSWLSLALTDLQMHTIMTANCHLDWLLNFTHQKDIISSFVALKKIGFGCTSAEITVQQSKSIWAVTMRVW